MGRKLGFGLVIVAVAAAMGLRMALTAWASPGLPPYITFYPAVMVVALLSGFWAGLAAAVLSCLLVACFLFPSGGQFFIASPTDRIAMVLFLFFGILMSVVADLIRRYRSKAMAYDRELVLRESQERLALAVSATRIGMFSWDFTTGSVFWTRAQDAILGYAPATTATTTTTTTTTEYDFHRWTDRIHPEDLSIFEEASRRCLQELKPLELQYRIIWPDSSLHWVETRGVFVSNSDSKPSSMLGVVMDITERKQAEDALHKSAMEIEDLYNNAPCGYHSLDKDGVFQRINNTELAWLRYERGEVIGRMKWSDVVATDSLQTFQTNFEQFKEVGYIRNLTYNMVRKDGTVFFGLLNATAIYDPQGNYISSRGMVLDITDRLEVELALRQSEEKFRNLFNNSGIGMFRSRIDGSEMLDMNRKFLDIVGSTREEVLGKPAVMLWADSKEREEMIRRLVADGSITDFEYKILNKQDGVRNCLASAVLYREQGIIEGSVVDITDLKLAEEHLRKSEDKYRTLIENLPQKIFYKDMNSVFISCNKNLADDLRIKPDEITGKTDYDFFPKELAEKYRADDKRLLELGKAEGIEEKYIQDGREVLVNTVKTPIFDDSGYVVGILGIFWDITQRKQAEDELRLAHEQLERRVLERTLELNKSNEQLRSLAAHLQSVREEERMNIARDIHDDLGQMLLALNMDLSWFGDKYGDHKPISEKIALMLSTLRAIIQSVKRICTELRPSILDDFGLVDSLQWQADEFQKRTGIECSVDDGLEDIEIDKEQSTALFRIFQEALTNVLKHAKATKVTARLTKDDENMILEVIDNGIGISDEQLHKPQSFGLIGMRERVYPWGGKVEVTRNRNKGTTVKVGIPF